MTPEQQAAIARAKARRAAAGGGESAWHRFRQTPIMQNIVGYGEIDTPGERLGQKVGDFLGAASQGTLLGWSDEIASRLASINPNTTYEKELAKARARLRRFEVENPKTALTTEIVGSLFPALMGVGAVGAAKSALGAIGTAAGLGAVEGAIYGAGVSEGGIEERAKGAVVPAAIGVVAGPVGMALGAGLSKLVNATRKALGKTAGEAVEREILRLVAQTGKTADEVIADLKSGRIITDNKDLIKALRGGYYTPGGAPSQRLAEELPERADTLRREAFSELQEGLVGEGGNVRKIVQASDDVARASEKAAYAPYATMAASDDLVSEAADALQRVPSAADEITTAFRADTGKTPFFSIADDGAVTLQRAPTVGEIEQMRRAINNVADRLYRDRQGSAAEAVLRVERALRAKLDKVKGLARVRADASTVRGARDAYVEGQRILTKGSEAASLAFDDAVKAGPEATASFRQGVMAEIKKRAEGPTRNAFLQRLSDAETKEGALLRIVFPDEQLDDILRQIKVAASAGRSAKEVLGGSPTASNLAEAASVGELAADGLLAMSGDPLSAARLVLGRLNKVKPMSDAQKMQVLDVLLSQNPAVLQKALQSDPAMRALIDALSKSAGISAGAVAAQNPGLLAQQN